MAQNQKVVVEAAARPERGKNEARRLRVTGRVPAVLYGGKGQSITLSVNAKQVNAILRSESGHNTLFQVDLDGKHEPAILKDWLNDPVSGKLLHVDLLRVAMDVRMRVQVPVHTFGDPAGVKQQGGVFEMVTREVEIECLPGDIPTEFKADVSGLMLNDALRARDLQMDTSKLKLITDPEFSFAPAPENVMKIYDFMRRVGALKNMPASWQELFLPDIHGLGGS